MKPIAYLVATVMLCGVQPICAQATPRLVSGRVFDDTTGCPLARAQVTVAGASAQAMTNAQGRYHFSNPPSTPFTLQVMLRGYAPAHTDSVLVTDSTGRVDFSLQRATPPDSKVRYPAATCHLEPAGPS